MPEPRELTVWLDFISPYAYLAWTQLPDLAARHGCRLKPVPMLFAASLDRYGHLGPAEIPPKRLFTFKDVVRKAARLGVPLVPPPGHPFNPLLALRVATAALEQAPDVAEAVITALFHRTWGVGAGVETPEDIEAALATIDLEASPLLAAIDADLKARVRAQTEAALNTGVFGVPTVGIPLEDGEMELFWGVDALIDVETWLNGEDPVTPALMARWRDLPASTRRPRSVS